MDDGRRDDRRHTMVVYVLVIWDAGFVVGPNGLMPRYGMLIVPVVLGPCSRSRARGGVRW
jgi:hypothetical protein